MRVAPCAARPAQPRSLVAAWTRFRQALQPKRAPRSVVRLFCCNTCGSLPSPSTRAARCAGARRFGARRRCLQLWRRGWMSFEARRTRPALVRLNPLHTGAHGIHRRLLVGLGGCCALFCHRRGAEWDGALARELTTSATCNLHNFLDYVFVCALDTCLKESAAACARRRKSPSQVTPSQVAPSQFNSKPSCSSQVTPSQVTDLAWADLAWADLAWVDLAWGKTRAKSRVSLRGIKSRLT